MEPRTPEGKNLQHLAFQRRQQITQSPPLLLIRTLSRDITVDKYAQGFRARFTISQAQLDAYMDEVWSTYGDQSVVKRGEMSTMELVDKESHELYYGDLGWPHLDDATELYGPTAGNGAGFSVWYSPSKRIAYQRGSYW